MAASGDLIDFNVIESHKENIQALPSGRSAKALAQLYSPPSLGAQPSPALVEDAHIKDRQAFEKELFTNDEADDPLDVYDRYVKWTLDAYPSAQATPQSRLLPLLERATKTFQSSSHYKNDVRYLKIWLHYIRLFSDAPREVFTFLARHSIGEGLALYYEEFAAWLENAGRWNQAEEIYKLGLEKEARPVERLLRKFGEFERRKAAQPTDVLEPSSPALPTVRPALAAKLDPFSSASPAQAEQQSRSTTSKKSKGSKMAIFSDSDEPARPSSGNSSQGWDNIGSVAERKKENTIEAKPWAGEKLKTGKTNGGMPKMMVFKDQSSRRHPIPLPTHLKQSILGGNHKQQCVPNPKNGRLECVFVNLEAVYPRVGKRSEEYCFEELRAKHRGWLRKDWTKPPQPKTNQPPQQLESMDLTLDVVSNEAVLKPSRPKTQAFAIFEDAPSSKPPTTTKQPGLDKLADTFSKTLALNDVNDENAPPRAQPQLSAAELAKKARKDDRANRTRKIKVMAVKHIKNETKTIQLNLDSPTGPNKLKRKKPGDRAEPTMTINTKEAMDEIYGIFAQPLPSQATHDEADEDDDDDSSDDSSEGDDDDYTTDGESTATGKLSGPASEYGDETRNELLQSQMRSSEVDVPSDNTAWSDFTTSKHVPQEEETPDLTSDEVGMCAEDQDEEGEYHHGRYVPVPPENYVAPIGPYRDVTVMANNRLPFMTPIAEQTEKSLSMGTGRASERGDLNSKTPSRNLDRGPDTTEADEVPSSPFEEDFTEISEDERRRVLQPVRTKSTKGTISLGKGTVQSQTSQISADAVVETKEAIQIVPIIMEERCNPMDPQVCSTILAAIQPALSTYPAYFEHRDTTAGRSAEIKKFIKSQAKARSNPDKTSSTTTTTTTTTTTGTDPSPILTLPGAAGKYTIKRELGAGTFAPVYLVENDASDDVANRKALEAIKMEDPPSRWEFYMLRETHRRLGSTSSRATTSIVRAHEMHVYRDECFLVEEYRDQGTLLDLVNLARLDHSNGGGLDESMAMWLTVELLRTVEAMHAQGLIHGDLKGDNVLVRFDDPGPESDWSPTYFRNGAHGWSSKGLCLIDFGRGIDMRRFVEGVGFIADWKTSEADCAEMRELRPWTYQIDYHGVAGVVHSLLFGKYIETVVERDAAVAAARVGGVGGGGGGGGPGANHKTYRIRETLKRYWQTELWARLFHVLLNPTAHVQDEADGKLPLVDGLRTCRERMETWLEENCERGMGLKASIARMEVAVAERRKRRA